MSMLCAFSNEGSVSVSVDLVTVYSSGDSESVGRSVQVQKRKTNAVNNL